MLVQRFEPQVRRFTKIIFFFVIIITALSSSNDSCIKTGSDESHVNVSLIVRDKDTNKTVSTDHNFFKRKESRSRFEPRSLCLPAYRLTTRSDRLTALSFVRCYFTHTETIWINY